MPMAGNNAPIRTRYSLDHEVCHHHIIPSFQPSLVAFHQIKQESLQEQRHQAIPTYRTTHGGRPLLRKEASHIRPDHPYR